jgi:carbon-monoxide dehydrogenase large subunit
MAHAKVVSIDTSAAAAVPGVVAVLTAAELGEAPFPPVFPFLNQEMMRSYLATDEVRFVGEAVAAILAETREAAADAVELVEVDYEPLDVVVDVATAAAGTLLAHSGSSNNVVFAFPAPKDEAAFAACEAVVEFEMVNQRVAPVPLEPRSSAARWDGDRVTVWSCSQNAHGTRGALAKALGVTEEHVRVVVPDVGGGFGAKMGDSPEEVLLPILAKQFGRPVRWTESRTESMLTLVHGRGQAQKITIGGTRDGKITAYRLEVLCDAGAYPGMGSLLPMMTRMMTTGVYELPHVENSFMTVSTNTTPTGAYRGAGRPEAAAAIERAMDYFAAEIGIDPADIRKKNFVQPAQFPYTTPMGTTYDIGDYEGALDRALEAAGYAELRAEQARRRAAQDPVQLGIGLAVYVEVTNPAGSPEFSSITITPEGGAVVRTGVSPHGQGTYTAFTMIASEITGIPMDKIEIRHGDTDDVPRGGGTAGSRSLQVGGSAVTGAANDVVDKAKSIAADRLEAAVEDVVLAAGRFHVAGAPAVSLGWADLAAGSPEPISVEHDFTPPGATFPFGAHVSVVEVDTETGAVAIRRHIACDDAGRIINPLLVDGQVHGGLAQGIAQALLEEIRYDEDGNPITSNLADYAAISAAELPSFERVSMETPTPLNPLGAKGIGESGTIGATPAVQNAVIDALSPLGIRHLDMPFTSERVWNAIAGVSK